jgi:zinc-ribbon domain
MHWNAYTVFSVVSGAVLLAAVFMPGLSPRDRLWGVLGGVFFVGYGIYVAGQSSGTFYFPWFIFVIPFAAVGLGVYKLASRPTATTPQLPHTEAPPSSPSGSATRFCPSCSAPVRPNVKFCVACGAPVSASRPQLPTGVGVAGGIAETPRVMTGPTEDW